MRPRVAIQAWLPGGPSIGMPSGARNRLLGLLRGLERIPSAAEWDVTLVVSKHEAIDTELFEAVDRLPQARAVRTEIAARPAWRRVAGEWQHAARVLAGFDLVEFASLPVPRIARAGSRPATNLVLHDMRDLGRYARGWYGARRLVAERGLRRAVANVDHFVVPSAPVADELTTTLALPRDRVLVVQPGLAPPPRSAWPTPRFQKGCFVSLARPEPRKDLEFALTAWLAAKRADPGVPDLVLAGPRDPRWKPLRRQVESESLEASVHFVHDLADHERWPLLAEASALLFPSRLEGFGLPALEAALVHCPSLVRADGVPAQVLGSATIRLPDALEAWIAAILEVSRGGLKPSARDYDAAIEPYALETAAASWVDSWRSSLEAWRRLLERPIRPGCSPASRTAAGSGAAETD